MVSQRRLGTCREATTLNCDVILSYFTDHALIILPTPGRLRSGVAWSVYVHPIADRSLAGVQCRVAVDHGVFHDPVYFMFDGFLAGLFVGLENRTGVGKHLEGMERSSFRVEDEEDEGVGREGMKTKPRQRDLIGDINQQ